MEINEVKIGDKVSFIYKKKKITGEVIHRHDATKNAALAGHVNVRPEEGRPHTLHVSKLKPANNIKEDIRMGNLKESILNLIDNIHAGNHVASNDIFNDLLQAKIDELLDAKKIEVSSGMFNTEDCADCDEEELEEVEQTNEALKGGQHKIDVNKNGKLDAMDFKMLRKKKGMKEETQLDELKKVLVSYIKKAAKDIAATERHLGERRPNAKQMKDDEKFLAQDRKKVVPMLRKRHDRLSGKHTQRRMKGIETATQKLAKEEFVGEEYYDTLSHSGRKAAQQDLEYRSAEHLRKLAAKKTTEPTKVKPVAAPAKNTTKNEAVIAPRATPSPDATAAAKADIEKARKKREATLAAAKAELASTSKAELKKSLYSKLYKKENVEHIAEITQDKRDEIKHELRHEEPYISRHDRQEMDRKDREHNKKQLELKSQREREERKAVQSPTAHAVHINGKPWKVFATKKHAESVGKKISSYGNDKKIEVHPHVPYKAPKIGESVEFVGEADVHDYYSDYASGKIDRNQMKLGYRNAHRKNDAKRAMSNLRSRLRGGSPKPSTQPATSSSQGKDSHAVHINGKKWKSFSSQSHASNVAKKIAAKKGEGHKVTVEKD